MQLENMATKPLSIFSRTRAYLPQLDAFWLPVAVLYSHTGPCAACKTDGQPTSEYKCGNRRVECTVRDLDESEKVELHHPRAVDGMSWSSPGFWSTPRVGWIANGRL